MAETLYALEVNCETGEAIRRPLTVEEIADRDAQAAAYAAQIAAEEAAVAQKAADRAAGIATLKSLGLTDAQINALLG